MSALLRIGWRSIFSRRKHNSLFLKKLPAETLLPVSFLKNLALSVKGLLAENQTEFNTNDLEYLKRSYFLLEIKDYLLMKRLTEKCGIKPTFILYFYSTKDACEECQRTGYVLTALRDKYTDLRVYSFDYHFDLGAISTLVSIYKV